MSPRKLEFIANKQRIQRCLSDLPSAGRGLLECISCFFSSPEIKDITNQIYLDILVTLQPILEQYLPRIAVSGNYLLTALLLSKIENSKLLTSDSINVLDDDATLVPHLSSQFSIATTHRHPGSKT